MRRLVDLADLEARQGGPGEAFARWPEHAAYVVDLETGAPVPLDVASGAFPLARDDVTSPARHDPRSGAPTLLFETVAEDRNGNGELDPGEDTDFDGVLDRPSSPGEDDPKRDKRPRRHPRGAARPRGARGTRRGLPRRAAALIDGAGGLADVVARGSEPALDSARARLLGPWLVTDPGEDQPAAESSCNAGEVSLRFAGATERGDPLETELACVPALRLDADDVLLVRTVSAREVRCAGATGGVPGRYQVPIAADRGDRIFVELYEDALLETPFREPTGGPPTRFSHAASSSKASTASSGTRSPPGHETSSSISTTSPKGRSASTTTDARANPEVRGRARKRPCAGCAGATPWRAPESASGPPPSARTPRLSCIR